MDAERVPRGATRSRHGPSDSLRATLLAILLGGIALGAAFLLPRMPVPGSGSAVTGPSPQSPASLIPGVTDAKPPLSPEEIQTIIDDQVKKPRFDDSIMGWRIGPYSALVAEGAGNPNPSLSCNARQAGEETASDLDFSVGYLPTDLKVVTIKGPMKWLCGDEGFSVSYNIEVRSALGVGQIGIDRFVQSERVLELDVPSDSLEKATVNGTPAIVVHPADDASGLGLGVVIVIEDDIGPELTVLRVFSDDAVPFAELIKIAEGIK